MITEYKFRVRWIFNALLILYLFSLFFTEVVQIFREGNFVYKQSICYSIKSKAGLNVRSGPGLQYDILATLPSGKKIERDSVIGEWSRIVHTSGEKGFVRTSLLRASTTDNYSMLVKTWGSVGLTIFALLLLYKYSIRHLIGYFYPRIKRINREKNSDYDFTNNQFPIEEAYLHPQAQDVLCSQSANDRTTVPDININIGISLEVLPSQEKPKVLPNLKKKETPKCVGCKETKVLNDDHLFCHSCYSEYKQYVAKKDKSKPSKNNRKIPTPHAFALFLKLKEEQKRLNMNDLEIKLEHEVRYKNSDKNERFFTKHVDIAFVYNPPKGRNIDIMYIEVDGSYHNKPEALCTDIQRTTGDFISNVSLHRISNKSICTFLREGQCNTHNPAVTLLDSYTKTLDKYTCNSNKQT